MEEKNEKIIPLGLCIVADNLNLCSIPRGPVLARRSSANFRKAFARACIGALNTRGMDEGDITDDVTQYMRAVYPELPAVHSSAYFYKQRGS
jgi:hypothetical protein